MRQRFLVLVEFISKLIGIIYVPTYLKKSTAERYSNLVRIQIGLQTGEFRQGDIIFSRTRGHLSNLFLGTWTHAGLLTSDGLVIEAVTDGGVQKTPLVKFVMGKDNLCIKRPNIRYNSTEVIRIASSLVGLEYDWTFSSENKIYCSELIRKAYGEPKWLPLVTRFGSPTLSPSDLFKNKTLQKFMEV